jgi:hypothetical protein
MRKWVELLQYCHCFESIGLPIAIALRFFICKNIIFVTYLQCMQVVARQEERTQHDVRAEWSSYLDVYVTEQDVHEQSVG